METKGLIKKDFSYNRNTYQWKYRHKSCFSGSFKRLPSYSLTTPESISVERLTLLKAYGVKVVLTNSSKGMRGYKKSRRVGKRDF
ncbi:MAG: hypothetical protein LBR59_01830 [Endomicrobium sp.]|nr:hypothetical protein [Endomicrobium sp.]